MIIIKKYRCHNGEIVQVEKIDDNNILVHYKGKKYSRNKSVIGRTLFPVSKNENVCSIGSVVKIKNCVTDEIMTIKICGVHAEKQYRRMGGSYYGNSTSVVYVGDDAEIVDGAVIVSAVSPFGKQLINKNAGEEVVVPLPDNKFEKYLIMCVE